MSAIGVTVAHAVQAVRDMQGTAEAGSETPTPRVDAEANNPMNSWQFGSWIKTDFARTLERELSQAKAELAEVRNLFPAILEALGNGAGCTKDVSLEFLAEIPSEVRLVVHAKDRELAKAKREEQRLESAISDLIQERERATDWADRLANRISEVTGADIGEHSNLCNPWHEAYEALDDFQENLQPGEGR